MTFWLIARETNNITQWLEVRDLDPRQCVPALNQILAGGPPELRREAAQALRRITAKFPSIDR